MTREAEVTSGWRVTPSLHKVEQRLPVFARARKEAHCPPRTVPPPPPIPYSPTLPRLTPTCSLPHTFLTPKPTLPLRKHHCFPTIIPIIMPVPHAFSHSPFPIFLSSFRTQFPHIPPHSFQVSIFSHFIIPIKITIPPISPLVPFPHFC